MTGIRERRIGAGTGRPGRSLRYASLRSEMNDLPELADPDPRRWFAAAVVIVSVAIPVLDNTILNVAIPTILREFHTDLPSLQWVITGYSLTFATFLDHRRTPRRHVRASPHVRHRCGHLRRGVAARVDVALGARARAGRGDHRGHRRVVADPGDAVDPVDDVRRRRTRGGVRGVGHGCRRFGRVRSVGRRLPHDAVLVAVGVAHQRDRRAAVRRRRAAADAEGRAARASPAHRPAGRGDDRHRFVPARVRAQRGRALRHVATVAGPLGQRPHGVAGVPPGIDRARGDRDLGAGAHRVLPLRTRQGAAQSRPALRVRSARAPELPVRPPDDDGARDGAVRAPARDPGAAPGRPALHRGPDRRVHAAHGTAHRLGRADRRALHEAHRHRSRRARGSRARSRRTRGRRAHDHAPHDLARARCRVPCSSASASGSRARNSPT